MRPLMVTFGHAAFMRRMLSSLVHNIRSAGRGAVPVIKNKSVSLRLHITAPPCEEHHLRGQTRPHQVMVHADANWLPVTA